MNNIFVNFYDGNSGAWVGFANFAIKEVFDKTVHNMLQDGYAAEITNELGEPTPYICQYFSTDSDGFAQQRNINE
jgi:hypothetical protein